MVPAETRSVDDQLAGRGNGAVMYAVHRDAGHADVWPAPADGSGAATRLIADAESPADLGIEAS